MLLLTQSRLSRHDNRWGGACWRSPLLLQYKKTSVFALMQVKRMAAPQLNEPKADIQPTPVGHSCLLLVMRTFLYTFHPSARALSLASFQARSRNSAWVIGRGYHPSSGSSLREARGKRKGYRQRRGSRLNSGLAQSASRSYPNNDLAGRSISGGSTRRLALTERTRSASTFLGLPLTRNSGKSSQRT